MSACPHCGEGRTERQVARALRNKLIVAEYCKGATQRELAERHGLTRAMVSIILGEAGARLDEAGVAKRRRAGLRRYWLEAQP